MGRFNGGGNESVLVLRGRDAAAFINAVFGEVATDQTANRSVKLESQTAGDAFGFLVLDAFDGKLSG